MNTETITFELALLDTRTLRQIARSAHKRDDLHTAAVVKGEIAKREQAQN